MTQRESTDELGPLVRDIARPIVIWAVHFTLVYAALSAACAPRGFISLSVAVVIVLVATVPAAIWALLSAWRAGPRDLGRAARWSGLISTLGILFNAAPVLLMDSCG